MDDLIYEIDLIEIESEAGEMLRVCEAPDRFVRFLHRYITGRIKLNLELQRLGDALEGFAAAFENAKLQIWLDEIPEVPE